MRSCGPWWNPSRFGKWASGSTTFAIAFAKADDLPADKASKIFHIRDRLPGMSASCLSGYRFVSKLGDHKNLAPDDFTDDAVAKFAVAG